MSEGLRLIAEGPSARPGWERVVASHPGLAVCHLPQWLDAMCEAGRFSDATRLYQTPDGRLVVLPMAHRRWPPGRLGLYDSWPSYWEGARDSGGLLGEYGIIGPDEVRAVVGDLTRLPALRVRVVPSTADADAWARGAPPSVGRTTLTSYVTDLSHGFERVWNERFSKKARYKCRKAEREGIEVEKDTSGRLLAVFDQLYSRSLDTWARDYYLPTPLARHVLEARHSHRKLEIVARHLGSTCQVWIAWRCGTPVSGIVVFSHGAAATYWKGATDKALVGSSGATDLLHRSAMEDACRAGRTRYDLGTSGLASLTAFKQSIGAQRIDHVAYQIERLPLTAWQESMRTAFKGTARALQTRLSGPPTIHARGHSPSHSG